MSPSPIGGPERFSRLATPSALLATAALGLVLPCFLYDLNLPDEPRVAHTSFEMLRTGDFVLPTVNGETFLDTPPCYYWMLALWFRVVGSQPEGVARLVSVACAVGTLLVTYLLTRRYAGARAALLSVAVLASTFHFWDVGHRVTVDMALTLFTNAALLSLAAILLESRTRWWWGPLLGLFAALAFLTKSIVGPGILSLVLAAMLLRHRDLWTRGRLVPLVASVITAVVALLPWIAALYARDPSYPAEMAIEHIWERAARGVAHNPSNWQFFHRMLLHLMPWTLVLPFVLYASGRRAWGRAANSAGEGRDAARFREFLLLSFLLPLVALLLSRGKRNLYLLPAVPSVAMLTGTWLSSRLDARRSVRVITVVVCCLGVVGAAGLIATLLVTPWAGAAGSAVVFAALIVHLYCGVKWLRRRLRAQRGAGGETRERARGDEGAVAAAAPEPDSGSSHRLSMSVRTAALLVVLCVAGWGSFYHVLRNPRYTAAPLGRRMAALQSRGYEIVSYRLFQREYAAVAWYLRRPVPHAEELQTLKDMIAGDGAEPRQRFALMTEASELEALGDLVSGWEEAARVELRRREVVVLLRE